MPNILLKYIMCFLDASPFYDCTKYFVLIQYYLYLVALLKFTAIIVVHIVYKKASLTVFNYINGEMIISYLFACSCNIFTIIVFTRFYLPLDILFLKEIYLEGDSYI